MSAFLKRLERLEALPDTRYEWQRVCSACRAEGRASTPYEHCQAAQCDRLHKELEGRISAEHAESVRQAFEESCRVDDQQVAAVMSQLRAEDEARREAWNRRKAILLSIGRQDAKHDSEAA